MGLEKYVKINGKMVYDNTFAYDNCHKIYILETLEDKLEAIKLGYKITLIEDIEKVYNNSCPLRFINNWKLTEVYAKQGENASFEWFTEDEVYNGK